MSRLALTALCLLCVVLPMLAFSGKALPDVGSAAPEFSLPTQDGSQLSLKDLRGKWVVLYFYPKDFTSGCTIEAHNFERDRAKYEQQNAVILGVSLDDVNSHKQFCVKEGLNFKLLADTEHKVSDAYGTYSSHGPMKYASRNTFLIDPNGKIARVFPDVNPQKHSEEVLSALSELQKKKT